MKRRLETRDWRLFAPRPTPHAPRLILLMLLLVAFALRVHQLDGQSMWSDEGLSLYRAQQSFVDNLKGIIFVDGTATQDTNPPFYFLLLHAWRGLLGETVFALRYLGVMAGLLSVPLLYHLGRRLYGRSPALIAALLLTISPFHIWQSQEMRNYPLLLLLNLLSVYGLFQLLRGLETRRLETGCKQRLPVSSLQFPSLLLWLCASLLGVATHYFGFFVFAFGVMVLLLVQWRQVWKWLLLAGVLALPLVWLAYGRFSAGQQFDFQQIPIGDLLQHAASVFSVGIIPGIIQPWWRILPVLLLVSLGVVAGWQQQRQSMGFTLGYLVIPLAILILLSFINPLYNGPRHLLIGLPAFLLLAAAAWRWRVGKLLLIVVVASQLQWNWVQFTAPELVKDDVRGVANYLDEVVRPGDAVILHDTLIGFTFDYYYEGEWTAVPRLGQNPQQVQEELTSLNANRLWFVAFPTPRTGFSVEFVPEILNSHFTHLLGRRFPSLWLGVKLDAYAPHPIVSTLPTDVPPYEAVWQNGLQLQGIKAETAVLSGHEWWPDLYWAGQAGSDVIASWRLFDEAGQLWAQVDRPLWEQFPPTEWPTEGLVYQPHQVIWPAGLPPGQYQVWLRLLDGATKQPIPLNDGQIRSLILPQLTVASAPDVALEQLPPHTALTADYGAIALVGYQLENESSYRPGHLLLVDAYWQAQGTIKQDDEWVVQLLDPQGQLTAETITSPSRATHPPTQWQRGELLHGQAILVVPPRAEGGTYTVQMGLRHSENGRFLRQTWFRQPLITLGTVEVAAWSFETELPPIATPLKVTIGEPTLAELKGFEVDGTAVTANTTLPITLFWQIQGETDSSYLVFIHLIGRDGTIVAQNDAMPVQGSRPTTSWRSGEALVDVHQLTIGADVAEGEYQLWVGLYDPDNGSRPPTFIDGVQQVDGRVLLGNITVTHD